VGLTIYSVKARVPTLSPNLFSAEYNIAIKYPKIGSKIQKKHFGALLASNLHWKNLEKILPH